jgi:chromosome partitioning protein
MIITLYSTKSSTKTSVAISTAVYLANQDKSVVFADLDVAQGSGTGWLDFRNANPKLKYIPCIQRSGIYVARELMELQRNYEYVVVDCAGHTDVNGRSALVASGIAIVPVLPSALSVMTLENTLNACIDAQAQNNDLKVVIVITGCSSSHLVKDTKDTKEAKEIIRKLIANKDNFYLAENTITAKKVWMEIVVNGYGITESGDKKAADQFNELMKEIFSWHSRNLSN